MKFYFLINYKFFLKFKNITQNPIIIQILRFNYFQLIVNLCLQDFILKDSF